MRAVIVIIKPRVEEFVDIDCGFGMTLRVVPVECDLSWRGHKVNFRFCHSDESDTKLIADA